MSRNELLSLCIAALMLAATNLSPVVSLGDNDDFQDFRLGSGMNSPGAGGDDIWTCPDASEAAVESMCNTAQTIGEHHNILLADLLNNDVEVAFDADGVSNAVDAYNQNSELKASDPIDDEEKQDIINALSAAENFDCSESCSHQSYLPQCLITDCFPDWPFPWDYDWRDWLIWGRVTGEGGIGDSENFANYYGSLLDDIFVEDDDQVVERSQSKIDSQWNEDENGNRPIDTLPTNGEIQVFLTMSAVHAYSVHFWDDNDDIEPASDIVVIWADAIATVVFWETGPGAVIAGAIASSIASKSVADNGGGDIWNCPDLAEGFEERCAAAEAIAQGHNTLVEDLEDWDCNSTWLTTCTFNAETFNEVVDIYNGNTDLVNDHGDVNDDDKQNTVNTMIAGKDFDCTESCSFESDLPQCLITNCFPDWPGPFGFPWDRPWWDWIIWGMVTGDGGTGNDETFASHYGALLDDMFIEDATPEKSQNSIDAQWSGDVGSRPVDALSDDQEQMMLVLSATHAYSAHYWDDDDDGTASSKSTTTTIWADAITTAVFFEFGPFAVIFGAAMSTITVKTIAGGSGNDDIWDCPDKAEGFEERCAAAELIAQGHNTLLASLDLDWSFTISANYVKIGAINNAIDIYNANDELVTAFGPVNEDFRDVLVMHLLLEGSTDAPIPPSAASLYWPNWDWDFTWPWWDFWVRGMLTEEGGTGDDETFKNHYDALLADLFVEDPTVEGSQATIDAQWSDEGREGRPIDALNADQQQAMLTLSATHAYSAHYWDDDDDNTEASKSEILTIWVDAIATVAFWELGPGSVIAGAIASTIASKTVSAIEGDADVWTCPIADAALCADARAVGQAHNFAMDRASDYNDQSLVWWGGTAEENEAAFDDLMDVARDIWPPVRDPPIEQGMDVGGHLLIEATGIVFPDDQRSGQLAGASFRELCIFPPGCDFSGSPGPTYPYPPEFMYAGVWNDDTLLFVREGAEATFAENLYNAENTDAGNKLFTDHFSNLDMSGDDWTCDDACFSMLTTHAVYSYSEDRNSESSVIWADAMGAAIGTLGGPWAALGLAVGLSYAASNGMKVAFQVDTDADGVFDENDDCPDTPAGSTVDANGCALEDRLSEVPGFIGISAIISLLGAALVSNRNRRPPQH